MKRLFNRASACLAAALAFALPVSAIAAPTATAVWRSNLGQSYTIGGNTYAVTPRNGTLNQDGTITVSSTWGDKAPYIDLEGANVGIVSVLVKYSGLDISQIYGADGDCIGVAFASIIDSDDNVVGSCVQKVDGVANNTVRAYHCGASAASATPRDIGTMTAVEGSGYLLFAFKDSQGSRSYMGTSIDNLTGGEDTAGHWSGRTLKKLVLGGDESGKAFNGAGFKIEEVAIFVGSYLTASDVADYVFPTVTADAAVTTMSALNAKVASLDNEFLYFSNAAVVTLDEEPSEATKAFLQGANWNGTVFIKDQNIVNLNPTIYGNQNSTLKLSGVSGHWGAAVYEKTATPAIELEDSETEGKEYGYYASNGYSFYSQGAYYYVHTPELKGSGTYKANTTGNGALFVADKFDNFTGKLNLEGKTVWLGTGAPTKSVDTWNNQVNFPGTVRLGSAIPANYAAWNVPNGYKGTVVKTTAADATETAFLTASTWKGTCQLNWNPGNSALDIVNYGNADSVVEIVTAFGPYPTQNGGADGAEFAGEIKLSANWTINNGWTAESYRTTFAKLSGSGTLTVNGGSGGVGDPIPYTITRLEGFTGTIAGARGKFTIGTIVAATEPTPGTKLVNFTTANAPVLDSTKVVYNNAEQDVELEFKAGDGIYVALPPSVTITVPVVANTTIEVSVGGEPVAPATEGESSNTYSVADGATVTVTYTSDGYEVTGGTFEFTASEGYTVDTTGVVTKQYVSYVVFQQESGQSFVDVTNYYTTVSNAIDAAKAMKKTVVLIAQPEATDKYNIAAGETINVKKGEFTFDGIIFPEGAQYNNTTTEIAGVTKYTCAVNTATIQYPGEDPQGVTTPLAMILNGLYTGYAPSLAGTVVTVLDGSDATLGDVMPEVFTYNSEAHTYTLKTMVASYTDGYATTYYPTLSNAVANVVAGGTIKVIADNTVTGPAIAFAKSLTLDLNGFTTTRSGSGHVFEPTEGATFTITDTSAGAAGKVVSSPKIVLSGSPCTVTINAGTLECGNVPVYLYGSSSSVVNINGGKLICRSSTTIDSCVMNHLGAVNMTGGEIESTVWGFQATDSSVSGGTVTVGANGVFYIQTSGQWVTGGTFNRDVSQYVFSGYEVVNNGDGTYTVRLDKGWVYEDADFPGHTGSWATPISYDEVTRKARIESGNTYTAGRASAAQIVTLQMTLSFDDINEDDEEIEGAKAAVRIGAGETEGSYVFQLYTSDSGSPKWVDVAADGVTPAVETDYTFTFVLDMTNKTYTATVKEASAAGEGAAFAAGGSDTFAFASATATDSVQSVEITGAGSFTSLIGSYEDAPVPEAFEENQTIGMVTLTAQQAAWLNGQNNYAALKAKIDEMQDPDFTTAYLLNLDILSDSYDGTYTFAVTKIEFGTDGANETVVVTVGLTRNGALEGGINGKLKLKGGNSLPASNFETLQEVTIGDDDFSEGSTTTCTFSKGANAAEFYQAVIE